MEKIFSDPFLKNQNRAYLWINSLKLYRVCFYGMPSWALSKYIGTKLQIFLLSQCQGNFVLLFVLHKRLCKTWKNTCEFHLYCWDLVCKVNECLIYCFRCKLRVYTEIIVCDHCMCNIFYLWQAVNGPLGHFFHDSNYLH